MGREIERRDHYESLTEKMQAIVDAAVEYPEATSKQLANVASGTLPQGESVSESYVRVVLRKQSHIVAEREEMAMNQREEGEMHTAIDGDPFQADALAGGEGAWQSIADRPVKTTDGSGNTIRIEGELTKQDVEHALQGTIPDRLYDAVLDQIVDKAF